MGWWARRLVDWWAGGLVGCLRDGGDGRLLGWWAGVGKVGWGEGLVVWWSSCKYGGLVRAGEMGDWCAGGLLGW